MILNVAVAGSAEAPAPLVWHQHFKIPPRATCRGGCACRPIKASIKFLVERLRDDALLGALCVDAPSDFDAICGSKNEADFGFQIRSIWGPKIGSIWGPKMGSNLDPIWSPGRSPHDLMGTLSH